MKKYLLIFIGILCTTILPLLISCDCDHHYPYEPDNIPKISSNFPGIQLTIDKMAENGWKLIFNDEFDGNWNDKWTCWESGGYNDELQLYRKQNLDVGYGMLMINPIREDIQGKTFHHSSEQDPTTLFHYTSGRIESNQLFSKPNGKVLKFSARIKLPKGYGLWPAFWSFGDPWPTKGEIDILEYNGKSYFDYYSTIHYGREEGTDLLGAIPSIRFGVYLDLSTEWHIFEVIWYDDKLVFRFDNSVEKILANEYLVDFINKEQKLVLNLAIGGEFLKPFDPNAIQLDKMYVDWVRVFEK